MSLFQLHHCSVSRHLFDCGFFSTFLVVAQVSFPIVANMLSERFHCFLQALPGIGWFRLLVCGAWILLGLPVIKAGPTCVPRALWSSLKNATFKCSLTALICADCLLLNLPDQIVFSIKDWSCCLSGFSKVIVRVLIFPLGVFTAATKSLVPFASSHYKIVAVVLLLSSTMMAL